MILLIENAVRNHLIISKVEEAGGRG